MARTLRDANLGTRAARLRLKPRGKPYYRQIESGLHLGYRRLKGRAGSWCVRQYVGDQSYVVETIAAADDYSDADGVAVLSFAQAQAKAREHMVRHAHAVAGKSGPLTVADAVRDYFEHQAMRGKPIDARYRAEALIIPVLGDVEVESLTTPTLQRWLAGVAAAKPRIRTAHGEAQRYRDIESDAETTRRRRSTANRTWTVLRAVLNQAWREGRVPSNAAWARVQPFHGVDAARLRFLSISECQRLINAADPGFRPLVQAALLTGCRYGEITRLKVADFHPDGGTISIQMSKSGQSRHVVLTAEGVEFFAQACISKSGDDHILTNGGGKPWKRSNQGKPMLLACARAGIEPAVNFHALRHTYASHAVMNGMPLVVLARNLGHTSTRMIERHYGHLSASYVADAVRASAPVFGLKPSNVRRIG
jgi:integrase